jgi:hypothetical protein
MPDPDAAHSSTQFEQKKPCKPESTTHFLRLNWGMQRFFGPFAVRFSSFVIRRPHLTHRILGQGRDRQAGIHPGVGGDNRTVDDV